MKVRQIEKSKIALLILVVVVSMVLGTPTPTVSAQTKEQKMGLHVLERLKVILKDRYFDRTYNGLDLDAVFETARQKMRNVANAGEVFIVANDTLSLLKDSHTSIFPPLRRQQNEFGFSSMMFGDQCFVTNVTAGSPAFEQGLKPGDEILSFGSVVPTRRNFKEIIKLLYWIAPVDLLELSVNGTDGKTRKFLLQANMVSIRDRKAALDKHAASEIRQPFVCKDISTDLVVCKLRTFLVDQRILNGLYRSLDGKKTLVLDLRGNRGGFLGTMTDLLERLFNKSVIIGTERARTGTKELTIKGRKDSFQGKLAILIDSSTGSAAELVSRVVQLEKRAKVFGDISSGAVRTSNTVVLPVPVTPGALGSPVMFSFVSVSIGDLIMSDGQPIEGIGVIPDVGLVPNNIAISKGFDPVLAHVLETMGVSMSPEEAGKLEFFSDRSLEFRINNVPSLPEYWAN